jgi:hypothetical protein
LNVGVCRKRFFHVLLSCAIGRLLPGNMLPLSKDLHLIITHQVAFIDDAHTNLTKEIFI